MKWTLITIDPSLRNLGIAMFGMTDEHISSLMCLGGIHNPAKDNDDWFLRASLMVQAVETFIESVRVTGEPFLLVTETQENWFGPKGEDSKNSGAIQKLYFFTGALSQLFPRVANYEGAYGIGPSTWKGQVSKEVMMDRAHRWLEAKGWGEPLNMTHDIAEALLLGKYVVQHIQLRAGEVYLEEPMQVLKEKSRVNLSNIQFTNCL